MIRALILLAAAGGGLSVSDDFERGIGRIWAVRQEQGGTLDIVAAPGRAGHALRARAGPKVDRVTKAALIARPPAMRAGQTVSIALDLYVPSGTALDSLQLVDLECATCGEGGNPGVRLYLRRGRLRIDRSKIGIRHAWTNDAAPVLLNDRWYRIGYQVRFGAAAGAAEVAVDGRPVLAAKGDTLLPGSDHADRIQIGITANSQPRAVAVLVDNVTVSIR